MKAVIFDIDGTLLDSQGVDGQLYGAAVEHVLGPVTLRDGWHAYEHVTDVGILEDIFADNSIAPSMDTIEEIRRIFFGLLTEHIARCGPFPEIPGAIRFIEHLAGSPDYAIGYATGGWTRSAVLKLESAGFPMLPLATSDNSKRRVDIMRHTLQLLGAQFESITYFGDASWDQAATQELGWRFQAVGKTLGGIADYRNLLRR